MFKNFNRIFTQIKVEVTVVSKCLLPRPSVSSVQRMFQRIVDLCSFKVTQNTIIRYF